MTSVKANDWPISSSNECLVLNDKIADLATIGHYPVSRFFRDVYDVVNLAHQLSLPLQKSEMRHVTHPALTDR